MSNILVFDSGVGGISVVREIKKLIPDISIDYLFDNLFYPYGELDEETLTERLTSLLSSVIRQTKPSLIVIACNTASTIALPALRKIFEVPIVGVVPAIKPAYASSQSKVIGLLATQGTIARSYIEELKQQHAPDCELISVGSNELVDMAEQSFCGLLIDQQRLQEICDPIFKQADVMILGCTHFPLLKDQIKAIAPKDILLVDSGKAIAQRVAQLLENSNKRQIKTPEVINHRAFYTKANINKLIMASLFSEGFNQTTLITH